MSLSNSPWIIKLNNPASSFIKLISHIFHLVQRLPLHPIILPTSFLKKRNIIIVVKIFMVIKFNSFDFILEFDVFLWVNSWNWVSEFVYLFYIVGFGLFEDAHSALSDCLLAAAIEILAGCSWGSWRWSLDIAWDTIFAHIFYFQVGQSSSAPWSSLGSTCSKIFVGFLVFTGKKFTFGSKFNPGCLLAGLWFNVGWRCGILKSASA